MNEFTVRTGLIVSTLSGEVSKYATLSSNGLVSLGEQVIPNLSGTISSKLDSSEFVSYSGNIDSEIQDLSAAISGGTGGSSYASGIVFDVTGVSGDIDSSDTSVQKALKSVSDGFLITKVSHGFTSGDVHRPLNINYALAKANSVSAIETIGMLTEVVDSDILRVKQVGRVRWSSHGLTSGQVYFVSALSSGEYEYNAPTSAGTFIKPFLRILNENEVEVMQIIMLEHLQALVEI